MVVHTRNLRLPIPNTNRIRYRIAKRPPAATIPTAEALRTWLRPLIAVLPYWQFVRASAVVPAVGLAFDWRVAIHVVSVP